MTKQKAGPGKRKRASRAFSAEYKAEEVRLLLERRASSGSVAQVARDLGVRAESLRLWAREQGGGVRTPVGETLTAGVSAVDAGSAARGPSCKEPPNG